MLKISLKSFELLLKHIRYGRTGKIHIDQDKYDEIRMIEDLIGAMEERELFTKIGYYEREELSRRESLPSPSIILSPLKMGKTGFFPNEFIKLLRLYELHYPKKYEELLKSHQEYSKLFSKADKVLIKSIRIR